MLKANTLSVRSWTILLLLASIVFVLLLSGRSRSDSGNLPACAERITSVIHGVERDVEAVLYGLDEISVDGFSGHFSQNQEEWSKQGISFFVFQGDSLVAWSDHQIPEAEDLIDLSASGPSLLLGNAWYLIRAREYEGFRAYGLFLLKYEYDYENRYLTRDFHPVFRLKERPSILSTIAEGSIPIKDELGETLFFIVDGEVYGPHPNRDLAILLVLALLLYILTFGLFSWLKRAMDPHLAWGIVAFCWLGLRWLSLSQSWLDLLLPEGVTSASHYAFSTWSPNLADFALNGFMFFTLIYLLNQMRNERSSGLLKVVRIVGPLVLLWAGYQIIQLIGSVVTDGQLVMELDGSQQTDAHTYLAYLAVSVYLLAWMGFADWIAHSTRSLNQIGWLFGPLAIGVVVGYLIAGQAAFRPAFWSTVILLYAALGLHASARIPKLAWGILGVAILSAAAAQTLETQFRIRDKARLETIAQQLLDGQDTDTELRYEEQQLAILSDTLLWNLMDRPVVDKDRIVSGLREGYFDGFFDRYELSLDVFEKADRLPDRYRFLPDTTPIGLYRPVNPELGLSYVLQVNPPSSDKRAIVDFVLRIIPEELGFPELLIKEESVMEQELREYSIARYRDGHLMDRFGDYAYRLDIPTFLGRKESEDKAFEQGDFWHYAFSRGTESYIISVRRKSFMGKVTTFTLAFSFISICMLLGIGLDTILFGRPLPRGDLQGRIQGLVIGVLFAALLVFGFGSYAYIVAQKETNSVGQLEEKVESVLIELSHKIEKENAIGNQALLQQYLVKFSKVFFTDINLYDLEGRLMASSRPEVFSRKLIAPLMPAEAYRQLHDESESRFVHEEHIGDLDFLSAYVPFTASDGEVLAYLNLPYFAKQGELEAELATFLIAVVNVLLILFVFSILLAVTVSSWITRPLQLLKDNLAAIRLGAENKPILYRGTDEIADLVREYNAKVAELQENAELLAQSERESAWREMAKQVAHEIKNPLTPMKLSLQYLQRSLEDRSDDWEERFERSTHMLIEQIDTLSGIATAFSDFAKMPQAAKEEFDLLSLLMQVVSLFEHSPDNQVYFISDLTGPQMIHADRGQFTRLINNLLKNAIQSIPDDQEGKVEVSLIKKGHRYIIEVQDNGEGIPEDMRDRIFQPNFTTKSTGTGLGLAMCKNIVHQAGGEIWFQTKEGQGTSFFVSLPLPDGSQ